MKWWPWCNYIMWHYWLTHFHLRALNHIISHCPHLSICPHSNPNPNSSPSTNLCTLWFYLYPPITFNMYCDFYTYLPLPIKILALWGPGSYFVHLCFDNDLHMGNKYVFSCILLIVCYSWIAFQWIFHYPVSLFMCISERRWQDVSEWALPGVGTFVKSPWIQVLLLNF